MRVWALANQKGGTGKTTAAVNLGAALADLGKRVLLIDLDPQAHASLALGVEGWEAGLLPALVDDVPLSALVIAASAGIHVVPSGPGLAEFEEQAEHLLHSERRLNRALGELEGRYDWVLIDCPPRADGALCSNALRASDTALLVVETGTFALQGALQARGMLLDLARRDHAEATLELRVLATLYDPRSRFSRELLHALQARFGTALLDTVVRESTELREAAACGSPVARLRPDGPSAAEFQRLAREVLATPGPERTASTPRKPVEEVTGVRSPSATDS